MPVVHARVDRDRDAGERRGDEYSAQAVEGEHLLRYLDAGRADGRDARSRRAVARRRGLAREGRAAKRSPHFLGGVREQELEVGIGHLSTMLRSIPVPFGCRENDAELPGYAGKQVLLFQ
jgi:hypothetical protein